MEPMEQRERADSASIKRTRIESESIAAEIEEADSWRRLREEMEEFLANEKNKVSRAAAYFIIQRFSMLEAEYVKEMVKRKEAEGIIQGYLMAHTDVDHKPEPWKTVPYRDAVKTPKVGKRTVLPRDPDKVVLVYPTDEKKVDSEETKKLIKESLAPKKEGIQVRSIRKVQKGGIVVETGTKSGATKIKEMTRTPTLRVVEPKKINPRVLIYDVDRQLEEEEVINCIWKQNLEELGIKEEEMKSGFRILFKTGRREADVVNLVVEMDSKIREPLIEAGRVYIDFSSCRVVDHLAVSRCYRCQGYGHVSKLCRKGAGESVCSHCGRGGHDYKDCKRQRQKPSCANCMAAKKPMVTLADEPKSLPTVHLRAHRHSGPPAI